MGRRGPGQLTKEFEGEFWRRWKGGETLRDISAAMHQYENTLFAVVRRHGGIVPRERSRSPRALSLAEREEISRGLCGGLSMREIARNLGRAPSSISREIGRNSAQWWRYRAHVAEQRAWDRALRPKRCHLAENPLLARLVAEKLRQDWSPQQIAGWLAREFSDDKSMRVSHETIYRSLFIQSRGVLKKELTRHLRRRRMVRRSRHYSGRKGHGRGQIPDTISIRERPAQVEDRAVPGHWEGDLLEGSNNTHIATLVERQSRYVILVKVSGYDTRTVVKALARAICKLPRHLRRSLTWDRGKEMSAHKAFSVATDVQVYFCDPYCPWQRGSNENTNGLLRQYFPKRTDLSGYSQAQLDRIALKLNLRPRQTLGFQTPAHKLIECVASTG
jgi:transposase, IS30 family